VLRLGQAEQFVTPLLVREGLAEHPAAFHVYARQRLAGVLVAHDAADRPRGDAHVVERGPVDALPPIVARDFFGRAGHRVQPYRGDGGPFDAEVDDALAAGAGQLEAAVGGGGQDGGLPGQRPEPVLGERVADVLADRLNIVPEVVACGGGHARHRELGTDNRLAVRVEDAPADRHVLDQPEGQFLRRRADIHPIAAVALRDRHDLGGRPVRGALLQLRPGDGEPKAAVQPTRGLLGTSRPVGGGIRQVELGPGHGLALGVQHPAPHLDSPCRRRLWLCLRQRPVSLGLRLLGLALLGRRLVGRRGPVPHQSAGGSGDADGQQQDGRNLGFAGEHGLARSLNESSHLRRSHVGDHTLAGRHLHGGSEGRIDQRSGNLARRRVQRERGDEQPGSEFEAAPAQAGPQQLAATLQPALDGPFGPAEQAGGLLQRLFLQAAEHQGGPVLLRQVLQLFKQQAPHFTQTQVEHRIRGRHGDSPILEDLPAGRVSFGAHRQAVGHPIQPTAHSLPPVDRAGLLREDQEGGLEGILGVVQIAQDAPAHTQYHRPVPFQQRREGVPVPVPGEPLQELVVRLLAVLAG
jgi:hypothetical protein